MSPLCVPGWAHDLPGRLQTEALVLTGTADLLLELLLGAVSAVVGKVLLGRDVVADVAGTWPWTTLGWAAVALVAVALGVGAWTAFWDD